MSYGMELILDLHQCKSVREDEIQDFCEQLCELINMQLGTFHLWKSEPDEDKDPKTFGTSAVQFILTSNITIHILPLLNCGTVYINLFSCKEFNAYQVFDFCKKWFCVRGLINSKIIERE